MAPARVSFLAGEKGEWRIEDVLPIVGEPLRFAPRLARVESDQFAEQADAVWSLQGVRSNERYVEAGEKQRLVGIQEDLGRPTSGCAVLIPLRKSAAWWAMPQDERRAIFEEKSHHIQLGLRYLPAVARRLYHCRDLGGRFDFLTWFEFAESASTAFDELLARLRATPEWTYVEHEVEVRLRSH